jgi:hypothetical protein
MIFKGNIHGEMAESGRSSYDEPPTTPSGPLQDHSSNPPPSTQPRYQQTFANTEAHGGSTSIQGIAGMAGMAPSPAHEAAAKEDHTAKRQNHIVQEFQHTNSGANSRIFQALELDKITVPFTQKFGNTEVGENASSLQGAMSPEVMKLFWSQPFPNTVTVHHMSLPRRDEVLEKTAGR